MRGIRVLKLLLLACVAVTAGVLLATFSSGLQAQDPAPKQEKAQVSGSLNNEDCAACHEDVVKAFDRNTHAVLEKSPRYNLKNSCESCHGLGEEHATGDGDKTKIIGFAGTAKKAYNQKCLDCHKSDHELVGFAVGQHSRSGLSCSDCHRVHSPAPMTRELKASPVQLCLSCHTERKADFARPFHHRVTEGAMRCIDCHQPHGGMERRQLRTTHAGESACLKCHGEKGGPFVFEHASLRLGGCQSCHQPHGSNNSKMLVRSTVRGLCLECHSSSSNLFSAQPPAFHDVRSPRYQNCTTCHTQIHGSNASRLFLR